MVTASKSALLVEELKAMEQTWKQGDGSMELWEAMEVKKGELRAALSDEKIKAGDPGAALVYFGSEQIAEQIVKLAPQLSDEQLREILTDEWTRCEAHRPYRREMVELFKRVGRINDPEELPRKLRGKTCTIFRGNLGEEEPDGISWTLKRKTAEWFASYGMSLRGQFLGLYREDGIPTVWSAQVDVADILAYFNTRQEEEVVVDPATLRNVIRLAEARP